MGVTSTDWTKASFEDCRVALKEWRENHARRSEEVVEIWEHVLSRSPNSLGDELWQVYEQVCIAALDSARTDLASECIRALYHRFPKSSRVLKLEAMQYEALEKYNAAAEIYDSLVEIDPTNNGFRKRKIALLLSQGKRLDAIKELNEYLKIFLNDSEAWIQLSELFLAENDLAKAAHCIEECVLASPLNTVYLRRLGDIRYSMGGQENIDLAKSYYEQAVKLNPNDLRALYGIVLASNYIVTHMKGSGGDRKKDVAAAGSSAASQIIEHYQKVQSSGSNPEISTLIDSVQQMKTALLTVKQ